MNNMSTCPDHEGSHAPIGVKSPNDWQPISPLVKKLCDNYHENIVPKCTGNVYDSVSRVFVVDPITNKIIAEFTPRK